MGKAIFDTASGIGRLVLEGGFTVENAGELRESLRDAVARTNNLVVDIAGVGRADLTFFQLLKAAEKSCRAGKKTIRLTDDAGPDLLAAAEKIGLGNITADWCRFEGEA